MVPAEGQIRPRHSIWRTIGFVFLVLLGTLAMTVAFAYAMGTVDVNVRDKGKDGGQVHVFVPSVLVTAGLKFVPSRELSRATAAVRPWLPALRVASRELAHCPDATLVEVRSRDETVSIVKRGNSLVVDVDDADSTVHIAVPVSLLASVAQVLDVSALPN